MPSRPVVLLRDTDLLAVAESVRRYASAALGPGGDAEDVAQEAVSRLLANRWRVDRHTAAGYAIATARSLIVSQRRGSDLDDRHRHRLHDPGGADDPVDAVLAGEEEALLSAALDRLDEPDRAVLLAHHVEGLSTRDLALLRASTPGAVGAALARARGRLRLEYCLQAHRREALEPRCRRILTAIAVGDGRGQTALGASRHLPTCDDCTTLSAALTSADRHSAMVGALGLIAGTVALLRRLLRTHPAVTATSAVVTAGVVAGVVYLPQHRNPAPVALVKAVAASRSSTPTATPSAPARTGVISGADDLLRLPAGTSLQSYVGRAVLGRSVPVLAVDADEGFWVGTPSDRLWVELKGRGESSFTVRAGTRIDFAGTVQANPPGYARHVGVTGLEDAAELTSQHAHLTVPAADIAAAP